MGIVFANPLSAHCLSVGVRSVDEHPVVQMVTERPLFAWILLINILTLIKLSFSSFSTGDREQSSIFSTCSNAGIQFCEFMVALTLQMPKLVLFEFPYFVFTHRISGMVLVPSNL